MYASLYVHAWCVGVHKDQKRVLDPGQHECWESNVCALQEWQAFLTTALSLQAQVQGI